ncbi:phasin family protein [Sphingobium lignivorans]|uniref:Uncharacterized protein YaaN involved in tellurite resistance n=1 Tax=Sphingobium lignivorans TaxID=2735886 RepID=A0ABR6NGI7_9SPHN|nr:phasin family protein [Sphingobium lignivorans]MBB5986399.1 uncharacterized protein YaaN involved in tellurite resistance [Sphingobium lignivorans]
MVSSVSFNPDFSAVEAMLPQVRRFAFTLPRMQASLAHIALQQQKEWLSFLTLRCERDMELLEQLSKTEDMTDVPGIVSNFFKRASDDYSQEARKSVEAGSQVVTEISREIETTQVPEARPGQRATVKAA